MRTDLVLWIKQNWEKCPVFNPSTPVHELIWLAHDVGITADERAVRGAWGGTPAERLEAYSELCDNIYFSDVEMLLFSSMMYELRGVAIVFRTWRCTGVCEDVGKFICTTPDREFMDSLAVTNQIIVDVSHTGRMDGKNAHYKLLNGGSLIDLITTRRIVTSTR